MTNSACIKIKEKVFLERLQENLTAVENTGRIQQIIIWLDSELEKMRVQDSFSSS